MTLVLAQFSQLNELNAKRIESENHSKQSKADNTKTTATFENLNKIGAPVYAQNFTTGKPECVPGVQWLTEWSLEPFELQQNNKPSKTNNMKKTATTKTAPTLNELRAACKLAAAESKKALDKIATLEASHSAAPVSTEPAPANVHTVSNGIYIGLNSMRAQGTGQMLENMNMLFESFIEANKADYEIRVDVTRTYQNILYLLNAMQVGNLDGIPFDNGHS